MAAATATKSVAKKAAPAKAKVAEEETPDKKAERLALGKEVAALRDDGTKWADIQEQFGTGTGALMFAEMCFRVKPSERLKYDDADELGAHVLELRDTDKLSWGQIAARANCGEGKVRSSYEAASGSSPLGNRIGKGGRYPTDYDGPRAEKPAKADGAAKAPAKSKLAELPLADLKVKFDGQTITLKNGDKIVVKVVQKKNPTTGQITLKTADNKALTLPLGDIKSVTKPKVAAA